MCLKQVYDYVIEEIRKLTTVDDDFAITILYAEKDKGYPVHVNVDYLKTGADCSSLSCAPFSADGVFEQATDASKRQTFVAIHTADPEDAEEKAGLIHLHLKKTFGEQHVHLIRNRDVKTVDTLPNNPDLPSIDNLRYHYGTGREISEGRGRNKKSQYRRGVQTKMGDIEVSVWKQMIYELMDRLGERKLFEQLRNYYKSSYPYWQDEMDLLMSYSHRVFDDEEWLGYIAFNRLHRPEVIKDKKLHSVTMDCCGETGEVTEAYYNKAIAGERIPCPVCGIWDMLTEI